MGTENEPVDVLQVVTTTGRRGAEVFAHALHPELERRGLSVRTVALVPGVEPTLPLASLGHRRLGWATLHALRREARRASVVIAHGSTTLPASAAATLLTGVPFVYRNIGDPFFWSTTRRQRLRSRMLLGRSAAVVALTAETGRRLQRHYGVPAAKVTPIPRSVSADDFPLADPERRRLARERLGIGENRRVALCLGALSPEKNIVAAVQTIALLPERWLLVIAGDGPDRSAVAATAAPLGERVRLLGQVDDPAGVLAAADLLLLPSRTEGLPGVVIEAALTGVPAVATDVGFVSEIIDHGRTGLLVPDAEDVAAMAHAVLDAELRLAALGAAAHERARHRFSLEAAADRWFEVISPFVTVARSAVP